MKDESTTIDIVVEIPSGGCNKYEINHSTGEIYLDRVLYSYVHYPADYGFVPKTKSADCDPLDALVIVYEPTFPGCRIRTRPIGVLLMRDEKDVDERILGVPVADPRFYGIKDISDLHKHWLVEIENFFNIYKTLEKKEISVEGWRGADEVRAVLKKYSL